MATRQHSILVDHDELLTLRTKIDKSNGTPENLGTRLLDALLATLLGSAGRSDAELLLEAGVLYVGSVPQDTPVPSPDAIAPPATRQPGYDTVDSGSVAT